MCKNRRKVLPGKVGMMEEKTGENRIGTSYEG